MMQAEKTVKPAQGRRFVSVVWLSLLALALALHVWNPRIDAGPLNDTYNVHVGGRNAFYQFAKRLESRGALFSAARNHKPVVSLLDGFEYDATLCFLGPARYPTPREWQAVLDWVQAGGRLLLAARWDDAELTIPRVQAQVKSTKPPDEGIFGSAKSKRTKSNKPKPPRSETPDEATTTESTAADKAATISKTGPLSSSLVPGGNFTWKTDGTIEAPGAEVLISSGASPQAVRLRYGGGTIVLVASDFIFSNAALYERDRQNALLAVKLLEAAGDTDTILFDESLNATGTPRVVGVLLDPALRPATLQLIIILVIFGWMGNRRFGGLLPKSAPARHDVADHTNSLGNLYYKAHHSTGVLREYLEQLRTELRLHFTAGNEARVLVPIAQKANLSLEELKRLLTEIATAARNPKLSRRGAAICIRRLAELRQQVRAASDGLKRVPKKGDPKQGEPGT